MKALWDFARLSDRNNISPYSYLSPSGLLRGKVGIECPSCGTKFLILDRSIIVARILTSAAVLAGVALGGQAFPRSQIPGEAAYRDFGIVLLVGAWSSPLFDRT